MFEHCAVAAARPVHAVSGVCNSAGKDVRRCLHINAEGGPVNRVRQVMGLALGADGRMTEITFNWNLNFERLTRLRDSCQTLRDHTRDVMGVAVK